MIDFPASPVNGQQFVSGGVTWIWDSVKWTALNTGAGFYVPLSGGTMTGPLTLNADPVLPLGAATKQSVDARGAGDNRLINGDMRIDQRNNGASGTAAVYTVDRWAYSASQASKGTWGRQTAGAGLLALGFGYSLQFNSSSVYTPATSEAFNFNQSIEADQIADFAWGTSNAQPVTLSFWVYSSLTGLFGGVLKQYGVARSYPFTFNIPAALTWAKIAITIPGDTGGTWTLQGNAGSANLMFDLGSGATMRGPANAWASGNYNGATGTVSVVSTNAAILAVTGVKLEIGSVATPYNRQSLAKSMADCQRYYQTVNVSIRGYSSVAAGSAVWTTTVSYATMRASPTATLITAGTIGNSTGASFSGSAPNTGSFQIGNSGIGDTFNLGSVYSLSAEL